MADQARECNVNKLPLENALSVFSLKKEESQENDFVDDKVQISETAIIAKNPEFQDRLIPAKMKLCGTSTNLDNVKEEFPTSDVKYDFTYHNLKIEEGSSTDNIKIEFINGLLYCEDCQVYCEDYCTKCGMLVHILNKAIPINAENISREELPNDDILEIQHYFGEFHVLALKSIPLGVRFGPFTGLNGTERSWKIKGGKFVVDNDKSKYLNWMQYINPARNISEQNLLAFQHEHELYYESTRQIHEGGELLVYFGKEYEDSLNRNVEKDFIPTAEHTFKNAFACTFCCLGFSSKWYLAKHKTICQKNSLERFSIEEVIQCPTCKVHFYQKEYMMHHMAYCCERKDRKCFQPTPDNETTQVAGRKTRPDKVYKCQQCKYRTKYKGDLKDHTNQHYEVKMYKCGICSRRFKIKEALRLHMRNTHDFVGGKEDWESPTVVSMKAHIKTEQSCSQDGIERFKCSLCAFRTKYKASLKKHITTKHLKEFNYKCNTCSYKTNWKSNLKQHIEIRHAKEFNYKCATCDYKSIWKANLKAHIEARHLKEFKYKCDTCDYKANQKALLKRHVESQHLKELKYKCDSCDYTTNLKSNLKTHVEARHLKEFKYKCDACHFKTHFKSSLKYHIESQHLKEFKYKCDTCAYKTNQKSYLKSHIETKHLKERKYKCDTCNYTTNWKGNLKAHIEARHSREFKNKCDMCDFETNAKSILKKHIQGKHLKELNYKCDICDYMTNWKSALWTHIKIKHSKEFKYKCDTCDYKANQKSYLKSHIETKHSKDLNYKCDACDYKTNRKFALGTHIKTRHLKEFKYKCDTCDFQSNQRSHLKTHIEAKHLNLFKYECDTCNFKTNFKCSLKKHIETKHFKVDI